MKRKLQIWNEGRKRRKTSDVGLELEVSVRINYLKLCVFVCVINFLSLSMDITRSNETPTALNTTNT